MYKVEIKFDSSKLTQVIWIEFVSRQTRFLKNEDLNCADRQPGRRVYLDRGRKQDYGRFWAAIFALKSAAGISMHLQECFWYNGSEKENLITEFMRN